MIHNRKQSKLCKVDVSITSKSHRMVRLTLHGSDIRALDVIIELGNLLLKLVQGDQLVLCKQIVRICITLKEDNATYRRRE